MSAAQQAGGLVLAGAVALGGVNLLDDPTIQAELDQATGQPSIELVQAAPTAPEPVAAANKAPEQESIAELEARLQQRKQSLRDKAKSKARGVLGKTLIRGDDIERLNRIVTEVGGTAAKIYGPPLPRSAKYDEVVKRLTKLMGAVNQFDKALIQAESVIQKQSVRGKRRLDQFEVQR